MYEKYIYKVEFFFVMNLKSLQKIAFYGTFYCIFFFIYLFEIHSCHEKQWVIETVLKSHYLKK